MSALRAQARGEGRKAIGRAQIAVAPQGRISRQQRNCRAARDYALDRSVPRHGRAKTTRVALGLELAMRHARALHKLGALLRCHRLTAEE